MDAREPSSPPAALDYQPRPRPEQRPKLLVPAIILISFATVVVLVGLRLLAWSFVAVRAAFEGAEGFPLVFAGVVGPLGLLFLGGGSYVMWRTVAALRRP